MSCRVANYCKRFQSVRKITLTGHNIIQNRKLCLTFSFKDGYYSQRISEKWGCLRMYVGHRFHTSGMSGHKHTTESTTSDNDDVNIEDEDYVGYLRDYCHIEGSFHQVMVIHPVEKWSAKKDTFLTTPELQMDEACALVHSLPKWKVVDKAIIKVKNLRGFIFGKGQLQELADKISDMRNVSAIFVNVRYLSINQVTLLQGAWKIPVFDRYTLVLHIFKEYAHTKEAKLQIAMAEIPYIRGRLEQINAGDHDTVTGHTHYVVSGGFKTTYMQHRHALLSARERRIKGELEKIKNQRSVLRRNRLKKQLPTVAVVGYTNSGKTTLIKALTEDESMSPENRLFATLDVTVHTAALPSQMNVLFLDTVGFISDIPKSLLKAFSATLEDTVLADVILHVRDVNHPDKEAQNENVINTLKSLLPEEKFSSIITVNNKCDLISEYDSTEELYISSVKRTGLDNLKALIEDRLIQNMGLMKKSFRIPSVGDHLGWLYDEATVQSVTDGRDEKSLVVRAIISKKAYERFKQQFSKKS